MTPDVHKGLNKYLILSISRLVSDKRRGDELAATINLLGLRVAAAAEKYFAQLGLKYDTADKWRHLKRTSKGIGKEVNQTLDEMSRTFDIPALAHHPDFQNYPEPGLSDIISRLDIIDICVDDLIDLLDVSDVIDGYLKVQSSAYKDSPFATPNALNTLLASLLVPDDRDVTSVYDPACGFGGSLLALHSVLRDRRRIEGVRFYGQDISPEATSVAAWRFLLRGITDFELEVGDTLLDPRFLEKNELKRFDVILASPPFYPVAARRLDQDDPFRRFHYGAVSSSRADYGFVQHVLASTAPSGRAAVNLALSALSRSGYEEEIRGRLVHADLLETVMHLPGGIGPYENKTFPPSSALLFDLAKPVELRDRVFFIDFSEVSIATKSEFLLAPDVLKKVKQRYARKSEHPNLSSWASVDNIRERSYSLLPQLYIPQTPPALTALDALEARIGELNGKLGKTLGAFDTALLSILDRDSVSTNH
jgi:type I restriction enzyme M protein